VGMSVDEEEKNQEKRNAARFENGAGEPSKC
jgi:hypothetical protein